MLFVDVDVSKSSSFFSFFHHVRAVSINIFVLHFLVILIFVNGRLIELVKIGITGMLKEWKILKNFSIHRQCCTTLKKLNEVQKS